MSGSPRAMGCAFACRLSKSKLEIDQTMGNLKEHIQMQQSGLDKQAMMNAAQARVKGILKKHGARPFLGLGMTVFSIFAVATPFR